MGTQENENADTRSEREGSGYCNPTYFKRLPASELLFPIYISTVENYAAYTYKKDYLYLYLINLLLPEKHDS